MNITENLQKAKHLLEESDALFITAGAGMGVDRVQIFLEKTDIVKAHICVYLEKYMCPFYLKNYS